jgi:cyclic nucleotide gated channel
MKFIDCGIGNANEEYGSDLNWASWKQNPNASNCFQTGGPLNGFDYGIYTKAVNLTGKNIIIRYIYSLFWGFQVCE